MFILNLCQARELERQLGVIKQKEVCLQRLHEQFRNVVNARPCDTLDADDIRAREIQAMQSQLETLHLELRDMRQINTVTKSEMDDEILQKNAALANIHQLESQLEVTKDHLNCEQVFIGEIWNALASVEHALHNSIHDLVELDVLLDALLQKVILLASMLSGDSLVINSGCDLNPGHIKGKGLLVQELLTSVFSTAASFHKKVKFLESELTEAVKLSNSTELQKADMIEGLSRWESTCSLLETLYVEQIELLNSRVESLQTHLLISACQVQEKERVNESLCTSLESTKSELEISSRQRDDLLSEVRFRNLLCFSSQLDG